MNFYTTSSFRDSISALTKKRKDGYMSVVKDLCDALTVMDDNTLRESNDRLFQFPEYRVVKLRIQNSGQKLAKNNGFRLIYWVSLKHDNVVLMRIYPKRGPQSAVDLLKSEYIRLQTELLIESQNHTLHQVDIYDLLAELSTATGLIRS